MKHISTLTLFAAGTALVAGCGAENAEDSTVRSKVERLETNAHYYLRCNATGWGADPSSRLIPDASGQVATLTYDVESSWMLQDSCVISQTNQLNGWGTQQSTYQASTSPLAAPGSSGVVAGSNFQIAYSELGTYTATLDLSSDTLSISSGSGDPGTCVVDGATTPPSTTTRANRDGYFVTPTAAATAMPWGASTTWNYTTAAPASGWTSESFNDSAWQSAPGGFYSGTLAGDVATTPWPSGESDLWLRTTVELTECDFEHLLLWGRWDDTMEVYINGVLASDQDGWSSGYRYLGLRDAAKNALMVGTNTVAVHVQDTGGGKYFDLGFVRNDKMSDRIEDGHFTTPEVEQFAIATKKFMIESGVPAGTLAVMKENDVVLSKSFGYADKYFTVPLQEGAVLRLASVDKAVSLNAMQDLIDEGTEQDPETSGPLSRDTLVYPLLVHHGLVPPPGVTVSPQDDVYDVTIQMLLDHTSGLRELPSASVIAGAFGITEEQITLEHNIRWMTSVAGYFSPGTSNQYCSSCYMLVRYIVELLKGDVVAHIRNVTLGPAEDAGIFLAAERLEDRQASEPWYATFEAPYSRWVNLEEYRALSATAPGLVRMLRRYEAVSGVKLLDPETGEWSLGIYGNGGEIMTGGMAGTASLAYQRRWDEVNIAFIFNVGVDFDPLFQQLDDIANNMSESDWGI